MRMPSPGMSSKPQIELSAQGRNVCVPDNCTSAGSAGSGHFLAFALKPQLCFRGLTHPWSMQLGHGPARQRSQNFFIIIDMRPQQFKQHEQQLRIKQCKKYICDNIEVFQRTYYSIYSIIAHSPLTGQYISFTWGLEGRTILSIGAWLEKQVCQWSGEGMEGQACLRSFSLIWEVKESSC